MRYRLLLAASVAATLSACSTSSSPTAPRRIKPIAPQAELTCRSGYQVAVRADGTEECVPQ